jgi:hypothetical protein
MFHTGCYCLSFATSLFVYISLLAFCFTLFCLVIGVWFHIVLFNYWSLVSHCFVYLLVLGFTFNFFFFSMFVLFNNNNVEFKFCINWIILLAMVTFIISVYVNKVIFFFKSDCLVIGVLFHVILFSYWFLVSHCSI